MANRCSTAHARGGLDRREGEEPRASAGLRLSAQAGEQSLTTTLAPQSNVEYILMSGSAKLIAIGITYPYQVIRSRIQVRSLRSLRSPSPSTYAPTSQLQYVHPTLPPYTSIPNCITRTYAAEGLVGFYKGLATNAVRILPGTCVTFVVYEQLSRYLSKNATQRE